MELFENELIIQGVTITLEFKDTIFVSADQELIIQVLQNLLKNAFASLPQSKRKEVLIKAYEDATWVYLSIEDTLKTKINPFLIK